MEVPSRWTLISIGLAIFSMFFGAGNLMYPIVVGVSSGDKTLFGLTGFLVSAVLLPVIGLIAMILFDGDYKAFFYRLGKIPGDVLIFASMIIIGPLIAVPRIVTLSHIMMKPFLPIMSASVFAIIFLLITFLCTFRESKIVQLLGNVISPLLVASLAIIIVKGFLSAGQVIPTETSAGLLLVKNMLLGYETMDMWAAIFFSSIVILLLKKTYGGAVASTKDYHRLAIIGLKAGLIGTSLLALVYVGLCFLGKFHGYGIMLNPGETFREVAFRVLGCYGAGIIGTAVFMACLSTAIALAAVVGEYLHHDVFRRRVGFVSSLVILLLLCLPLSISGLDQVLKLTGGPILYIAYPILVTITFCNIGYKLFGFKPIKLPVAAVAVLATFAYFWF